MRFCYDVLFETFIPRSWARGCNMDASPTNLKQVIYAKNICRDWDRCESWDCKHEISVQIMLDLVDKSCLFYTKPANVLAYQWDGKYSDISCLFIYAKHNNCNQFNKLPTHNCVLLVLPVYKSWLKASHRGNIYYQKGIFASLQSVPNLRIF